jgi:hypothetical protein
MIPIYIIYLDIFKLVIVLLLIIMIIYMSLLNIIIAKIVKRYPLPIGPFNSG